MSDKEGNEICPFCGEPTELYNNNGYAHYYCISLYESSRFDGK